MALVLAFTFGGLLGMGAPKWPPYPPTLVAAPAKPWRASTPTLVAPGEAVARLDPRRSSRPAKPWRASDPRRSSRPGEAVARLDPNAVAPREAVARVDLPTEY